MRTHAKGRVSNRWLIAAMCTLLQLCLGTVYAWSYFQPLLVEQKIADPQHQAPQAELGVGGNHRDGQASRGRGLELAVVLDDPDNKENEASQNGDHPGKQGDDAHLNLISDASELSSRAREVRTGN